MNGKTKNIQILLFIGGFNGKIRNNTFICLIVFTSENVTFLSLDSWVKLKLGLNLSKSKWLNNFFCHNKIKNMSSIHLHSTWTVKMNEYGVVSLVLMVVLEISCLILPLSQINFFQKQTYSLVI